MFYPEKKKAFHLLFLLLCNQSNDFPEQFSCVMCCLYVGNTVDLL